MSFLRELQYILFAFVRCRTGYYRGKSAQIDPDGISTIKGIRYTHKNRCNYRLRKEEKEIVRGLERNYELSSNEIYES